jgi:hypothetical protein
MGLIENITTNGRVGSLGLAGILTGLLVLGGFTFFFLVIDDGSLTSSDRSLLGVTREQDLRLESLRGEISNTGRTVVDREHLESEFQGTSQLTIQNEGRLSATAERAETLANEVLSLKQAFQSYRDSYRARVWTAARGEAIPLLTLKSGKRYENVTISRVTPAGLEIAFPDGRARILAGDLDDQWQDRFDWDPTR